MAKTQFTLAEVARITKRSEGIIGKLAKTGKIVAERGHSKKGRPAWLITHVGPREELVALIHKLVPKGGYRKNVAAKKTKKTPLALQQVLQFMELSDNTRQMLLLIGQKAAEETLELLVGLV